MTTGRVRRDTARREGGAWAHFWDDRKGVSLKLVLLVGCMMAASLLEVVR